MSTLRYVALFGIATLLFFVLSATALAQERIAVVIDESGEGLSQALVEYYVGTGMSEQAALDKAISQLGNSVFYRGGVLQDLVHVGDLIALDASGNVAGFTPVTPVGRLPDFISLSGSEVRVGSAVVVIPEGVTVEAVTNAIDQHVNLVLANGSGDMFRVMAYETGGMALVNGESVNFGNWLAQVANVDVGAVTVLSDTTAESIAGTGAEEAAVVAGEGASGETGQGAALLGLSANAWIVVIAIILLIALGVVWYRGGREKRGSPVGQPIDLGL